SEKPGSRLMTHGSWRLKQVSRMSHKPWAMSRFIMTNMTAQLSRRMLWIALAVFAAGVAMPEAQTPATPPAQTPPPHTATQNPPTPAAPAATQQPREVIRRSVDLITTDVIVRNNDGQFVADLSKGDFDVYEDGVKQDLVTFVLTHGGRILNDTSAPPP